MTIFKRDNLFLISCLLFCLNTQVQAKNHSIEFFYSNNDQVIDIKKAFTRLIGNEQRQLEKKAIKILQSEHIEQGKFKNILGTYTLSNNGAITADNSEVFFTSPLQNISRHNVFNIAVKMANELNQESVAVFIPSKTYSIAHIKIIFDKDSPSINKAIKLIHDKLQPSYTQAFSLNLNTNSLDYNSVTVHSIEWIGHDFNVDDIKKCFPLEKISYMTGESFLIYKDGRKEKL